MYGVLIIGANKVINSNESVFEYLQSIIVLFIRTDNQMLTLKCHTKFAPDNIIISFYYFS